MTAPSPPSPDGPGRATWAAALAAAVLLGLRKPWALHTPQLWAEDGSIFLVQDEQLGLGAWLTPYNGYLHLLPRLVAWAAARTADVAWWPAIYNGATALVTLAVLGRLASRRVELPAKPLLLLALPCAVGTGEVLLNLTNLQWPAALFLLLQAFLRPPRGGAQRAGDLALLAIVGLNGPFALVFAPVLAWRWWTERGADALAALLVTGACAVTQLGFLTQAPLSINSVAEPFHLGRGLSILGSRLVTWPLFGPDAVRALPATFHATLGAAVIGVLLARGLRADPLRPARTRLALAFVIVTAACAFRARADTWAADTMENGDRYFFLPRLLLLWLLVLEAAAGARAAVWTARALLAGAVLAAAPHWRLPAPPDYRWAEHCGAIRRGVPANIPTLPEGWYIEYPGRSRPPP